jgi:hypothetical protein
MGYFKGGHLTYGIKQATLVSTYCMENMYGAWTELFGTFYFEREEDMFMVKMVYGAGIDDDMAYKRLINDSEDHY